MYKYVYIILLSRRVERQLGKIRCHSYMILYIGEGYPSLCRNLHHTSKLSALSMYSSVCADVGRPGRDSHSSQPFHCYAEAATLSDSVLQSVDLSRPLFYKDLSFVSFRAGAAGLRRCRRIWWHGNLGSWGEFVCAAAAAFPFLPAVRQLRWSYSDGDFRDGGAMSLL